MIESRKIAYDIQNMAHFIAVLATAPPSGRIVTKTGIFGDGGDVINRVKFHVDR
jgi:hypothetical protein